MSATKQGFYSRLSLSPANFRRFMNLWPPFWGMRIHILTISDDWRHVRMRMKLGLRNKNYVGTHFGGGLFAMVDPFYMIMMSNILGRGYLVWDKSAQIDFISPGRTTVFADFRLDEAALAEVLAQTAGGEKFEPTYSVDIVDTEGKLVARVRKTLYIRRNLEKPQTSRAEPSSVKG
jgi:acyl-coenzyme A thioesterase PaaI-like protein